MNPLEQLADAWLDAKRVENDAIAKRRALDAQIAALMDTSEPEGTATEKLTGLKVSVTHKLNRKVDIATLQDAWMALSADVQAAFRWKAEVNTSAMRKLSGADYAAFSRFVTAEPATPTVKVETL